MPDTYTRHWQIISATQRKEGLSNQISDTLALQSAQILSPHDSCEVMRLSDLPLPMWSEDYPNGKPAEWANFSQNFSQASAFIIVCPEWNGGITPALHNLLFLSEASEVGHKPALIVSVSQGGGGAFVVSALRGSAYKNNRLLYIPEHLIIRGGKDFFENTYLIERAAYCMRILKLYDDAMSSARKSHPKVLFDPAYSSGMS